MNEEVQRDDHPRHGRAAVELGVAEDGGRGVVEDVEELEGLLLDDEEDCVKQLPVCGRGEGSARETARRAFSRRTLELRARA